MADTNRLPVLLLLVLIAALSVIAERQRTSTNEQKSAQKVTPDEHFDTSSPSDGDDMDNFQVSGGWADGPSENLWFYSLLSAGLVGLSGIFPLLVIPLEGGSSLKHGAAASKLKLLLSFAVGSLLGDVFLHLLPEAWMHVKKGQEHQHGTSIGLWVMCGILTFLIIEKIFPANSEEFEDNIEEEIPRLSDMKQVEDISAEVNHNQNIIQSKTSTISNKLPGNKQTVTKEDYLKHRYLKSNSMKSKSKEVLNGEGGNDEVMEYDTGGKKKNMEGTIHVRGYLNLMANVIDNFTHGLAVGGSYIVSTKVGLLTTFAIMVHEIPHEVGDFAILLRSGFDRWQAAKAQLFTASGSLLGAIVALTADSVEAAGNSTAWILPFTSGGFIYIALVTVAPDLLKEKDTWESFKQVMGVCLGVCTMAFVTILCG